jgi:exopolysaccharide biosynthesis predicted pyruvyltransferase EpsI
VSARVVRGVIRGRPGARAGPFVVPDPPPAADVLPAEADVVLQRIRRMVDDVTRDLVAPGAEVALLNFPNHRNAGDDALWLAAESLLARRGARVVHRAAWTVDVDELARRLRPGTLVVLNGGGNLGDLYPDGQQRTREQVLSTLRADRGFEVLQLPQSIHFADPGAERRVADLFAAHGAATILCRDVPSVQRASRWPGVEVGWCPDLVFLLGPFRRRRPPEVDIVWLGRRDPEARHGSPGANDDVHVVDWLAPLPSESLWPTGHRVAHAAAQALVGSARPAPRLGRSPWAGRVAAASFAPLARGWLERGLGILHGGRVVVTDRLHAHLLAWLSGIPSVVLDNSYGKVHALVRETTLGSPGVALAHSVPEALDAARRLVATTREEPR